MESISTDKLNEYWLLAKGMIMEYGLKIVYAIIVLMIGLWIIKKNTNGIKK